MVAIDYSTEPGHRIDIVSILRASVVQLQYCSIEVQWLGNLLAEFAGLMGAANQGALFRGVRCTQEAANELSGSLCVDASAIN